MPPVTVFTVCIHEGLSGPVGDQALGEGGLKSWGEAEEQALLRKRGLGEKEGGVPGHTKDLEGN